MGDKPPKVSFGKRPISEALEFTLEDTKLIRIGELVSTQFSLGKKLSNYLGLIQSCRI